MGTIFVILCAIGAILCMPGKTSTDKIIGWLVILGLLSVIVVGLLLPQAQ